MPFSDILPAIDDATDQTVYEEGTGEPLVIYSTVTATNPTGSDQITIVWIQET